jgi:hypothetical protein
MIGQARVARTFLSAAGWRYSLLYGQPGHGLPDEARCARRRGDDPISWLAVSPASHEEPSIAEVFVLSNVSWKVGIKAQRCGWREGVYMDDVPGI